MLLDLGQDIVLNKYHYQVLVISKMAIIKYLVEKSI